jgi:hypothetical protein
MDSDDAYYLLGRYQLTIPSHNLNELRLKREHLIPSVSDQLLTDEHPILGVEVCREPWRDGCGSMSASNPMLALTMKKTYEPYMVYQQDRSQTYRPKSWSSVQR